MSTSTIISCVSIVLVAVIICVWDWYCYRHVRPKHTLKAVEERLERLQKEINEHQYDNKYPIQTCYDIWDYWDSERTRIKEWNKRHPDDMV